MTTRGDKNRVEAEAGGRSETHSAEAGGLAGIVGIGGSVEGPKTIRTTLGAPPVGKSSKASCSAPPEDLASAGAPLARIYAMLRNASGVDFTHYKQPTITRRLRRRMNLHRITTLEQYLGFLRHNPAEVPALYQDILIPVTQFFREPESFRLLAARVFPKIRETRRGEAPIRVWVPGCSTGEEPYSVAIALLEFLGAEASTVPVQIFATDVSEAALEIARAGVYPESISGDVSPERLRRFFTRTGGNYRLAKRVRDCCMFVRQDLTRDPPFSRLDLTVCRNVLIYLEPVLQKRLIEAFHHALKPTGFLMLGGAETVGPHVDLFAMVEKRHKLYTRKRIVPRTKTAGPAAKPPAAGSAPAREEMPSTNQEMLSSYEKLQRTRKELAMAREELQSTNEELHTLDETLHTRNQELMQAHSDLINLLASVRIAVVMVAGDLRIRRYTPMAEKVLNLIPANVGRSISDIKQNLDCADLETLISDAIDTMTIKERKVRDRRGNWYSLRIRPYRNIENRIDGAVLALFAGERPYDS